MDYQVLMDMQAMQKAAAVAVGVWGADNPPITDTLMRVTAMRGGVVLGALTDAGEMVGMSWAFPLRDRDTGDFLLWSHVTGVLPTHQGQGIGFSLKQAQRSWALENGYTRIRWTFDPMRARNAELNLHELGAYADSYVESVYGDRVDAQNLGLPTDRYEATWDLNDVRVQALAAGQTIAPFAQDFPYEHFLLRVHGDEDELCADPVNWNLPYYCIEVPADLAVLQERSLAYLKAWQGQVRILSQDAFAQGYRAVDFIRQDMRCWYLFTRAE